MRGKAVELTNHQINQLISDDQYMIPHCGFCISSTDQDSTVVEETGIQHQINVPKKYFKGLRSEDLNTVKVGFKTEFGVSVRITEPFETEHKFDTTLQKHTIHLSKQ